MGRPVLVSEVTELTASLCVEANFHTRPDVRAKLEDALKSNNSAPAHSALEQLVENMDMSLLGDLPLCQDCGYVTIFAQVGQEVDFDGVLADALQAGVNSGYARASLRQSVIANPLVDRSTLEKSSPAKIYIDLVAGDRFSLTVMPKGGGSDNAGRLTMMRPTGGEDEIVEFVVDTVRSTGANACPPLFIGVGVGGSFDSVALIAKKALLRDFYERSSDPVARKLEERLFTDLNQLGIGPAGLGGASTALGVAVETAPTHLACLPVAVNISCNQLRSATGEI